MKVCTFTLVAAIALGAMACTGEASTSASREVQPASSSQQRAVPIAEGFVTALGTYHADEAIGYLADGADLSGVTDVGTPEELRLLVSWFEATGYEQKNIACDVAATLTSGTDVRCTFDFQAFRSAEIGRGPYSGSSYDLMIRDDQIQSASLDWEIGEFSPQVWEPFSKWIAKTYPEDGAVMFNPHYTDFRLSKESVRLWEQHTTEYVKLVGS